jgi:hypothetical protein
MLQDHQSDDPAEQVLHSDHAENSFVLFSSTERTPFGSDSATLSDQFCFISLEDLNDEVPRWSGRV